MTPSLPDDLYREIMKHVPSRHDLYHLSLSSRAFQADAEYFLYRHLESSRWPRTEDLCLLVIRSPRLHPLVRSLSITNEGMKLPPSPKYWDCISKLLMYLPNLTSLKIYNGLSMANSNSWVLDKCIASLRRVEVDFELDNHFINFLVNQPLLTQIHWINSSRQDVSSVVIQSLQSLSPSPSRFLPLASEVMTNCCPFAVYLLNSARVTHLWLWGHAPDEDGGVPQLITQFTDRAMTLRSLRINFPLRKRMCIAILTELVQRVPKLRSIGFLPYFDANVCFLLLLLMSLDQITI